MTDCRKIRFYNDNKTFALSIFFSMIEFYKEYYKVLFQVNTMLPCFDNEL